VNLRAEAERRYVDARERALLTREAWMAADRPFVDGSALVIDATSHLWSTPSGRSALRTHMTRWGERVASSIRFVFANEPCARLATLRGRLDAALQQLL
jgi:hypothetical protein